MRRLWMTVSAAFALGAPCADAAEFRMALGGWGYHLDGTVDDRGQRYDFRDDLALDATRRRSLLLEWDTPRGWWPDLAASFSQIGAAGDHEETTLIGPVTETRTITTDADFDNYDLVARYPFRLGALRGAAGLALQQLRGEMLIVDSDDAAPRRERYDEVFPQLHAQLRWRLGPLALVASGQGIEHGGNRALEWRASAELRFMEPLLLELGWQEKRYEIGLADYALDARLRGALLRIGFLYR